MALQTTRRRLLAALGTATTLGAAGCTGEATTSEGDWPSYGRDTRNSGYNPHTAGPRESPTVDWVFEPFGWSAPAVVGDTIYVGSNNEYFYAVDPTDGSQKWQYETDDRVNSYPAVDEGAVVFTSEEKFLHSVNAASGDRIWRTEIQDIDTGSPTIHDGTIYIGALDGTFYAVDAADGSVEWEFQAKWNIPHPPAVVDDMVFMASDTLYALDAGSGEEVWRFDIDAYGVTTYHMTAGPTATHDTVFFGTDFSKMHAFDVQTGEQRWVFETDMAVRSPPAVADGVLYFGCEDDHVYAVAAGTGEEIWNFDTGALVRSAPAVSAETVYLGTTDGYVHALDRASGEELWRLFPEIRAQMTAPLVVANDTLYTSSSDLIAIS